MGINKMKINGFKTALACAFLALSLSAYAQDYDFGLHINTYPSPREAYTGLLLENGEGFPLKGEALTMEFDMRTRCENIFGTVFRIITDKNDNVDLMYTVGLDDKHYPILVTGESVHDIPSEITPNKWIHVSISLDPRSGEICMFYDKAELKTRDAGTKGAKNMRIAFGLCPIPGHVLDDVASIDVRDIAISRKDKLIRHWDLSVHDGDICRDNIKSSPAVAFHPQWIVDQYIQWDPVAELEFASGPSVAFDPNGIFLITADGKTITTFDVNSNEKKSIQSYGGFFSANAPNQLVFVRDTLYAYNLCEQLCSRFNFESKKWEGGAESVRDHDYWNNSACVWEKEGAIISFGGYGHFHYNNDLLVFYPKNPELSHTHKIEAITPRYGSATIVLNDTLYVYGGRGNLSGKQELSPKFYSDFYAVDLNTMDVVKYWDTTGQNGAFILGEKMVYDSEENCFYALASMKGGVLIKLRRDEPGYEEMTTSCGFNGGFQYVNYNIYKQEEANSLYAVHTMMAVDSNSKVIIKKMNWPPIPMQILHQSRLPQPKDSNTNTYAWYIVALMAAAALCIAGAAYERRKMAAKKKQMDFAINIDPEIKYYDFSKNSINFFGGFRVKDKNGNDITSLFTPNLKALTILLLFNSADGHPGISSGKLNRTIWSYKPEDAANNNRNVYISKLRSILENLDGFTISNKNKLWRISLSEEAKCDWIYAMRLINDTNNEENINRLVELMLRGVMLPDTEFEWLDNYKGHFSNLAIDMLGKLLDREDIPGALRIKVADTIFLHDYLNEEALRAKCRILCQEGKTGLAKNIYNNFCKEYSTSIGMDYGVDFKSLISD